MYWTYNQRSGQLRDPQGRLCSGEGYSGAGPYKNLPEAERLRGAGPIPAGLYKIGAATGTRGPLTLPLLPLGHDAAGRTNLRIHGDSAKRPGEASTGCIILARAMREAICNSKSTELLVVNEPEWSV
ncbi:MAG: DUF2778 domain-containing protein [Deltaproteobacteria bacterium]|jgi:hypothetical protein|nr:DUF2778 domain-containing protein [Deltaproteobacteria bacterium]